MISRNALAGLVMAGTLAVSIAGGLSAAPKAKAKPKADFANGQKVYKAEGCVGCHKIKGEGGASGPALDGIGKKMNAATIAEKIRNPKKGHPSSTMPATKLNAKDSLDISAWLASLK